MGATVVEGTVEIGEERLPEKKPGLWSYCHDPRQIVGEFDYIDNSIIYNESLKENLSFVESEYLYYQDHTIDDDKDTTLQTTKNVVAKLEDNDAYCSSFERLIDNLQETHEKFQRELIDILEYCSLNEKEYLENKEMLDEQVVNLNRQLANTLILMRMTVNQYRAVKNMLKGYSEKESILGD